MTKFTDDVLDKFYCGLNYFKNNQILKMRCNFVWDRVNNDYVDNGVTKQITSITSNLIKYRKCPREYLYNKKNCSVFYLSIVITFSGKE